MVSMSCQCGLVGAFGDEPISKLYYFAAVKGQHDNDKAHGTKPAGVSVWVPMKDGEFHRPHNTGQWWFYT